MSGTLDNENDNEDKDDDDDDNNNNNNHQYMFYLGLLKNKKLFSYLCAGHL
jgi:hypothetical protein